MGRYRNYLSVCWLSKMDETAIMVNCFIAMPISLLDIYADRYNDPKHFKHVLDHLFTPALEAAGYKVVPPVVSGSDLIQAEIIRNLETCDLVLCDISTLNPNVFFELGIRTSLDRPLALVRDNFTVQIPFDTGSINAHTYDASLRPWTLPSEVEALTAHIQQVTERSGNRNALWRYFGLTQRASPAEIANPTDAKLDLLIDQVTRLAQRSDTAPSLSSLPTISSQRIGSEYERQVSNALREMGYFVWKSIRGGGFDLFVEGPNSRLISVQLMSAVTNVSSRLNAIVEQASSASAPVLLITRTGLPVGSERALTSGNLRAVRWTDSSDDDRLAETLRHMFASLPGALPGAPPGLNIAEDDPS